MFPAFQQVLEYLSIDEIAALTTTCKEARAALTHFQCLAQLEKSFTYNRGLHRRLFPNAVFFQSNPDPYAKLHYLFELRRWRVHLDPELPQWMRDSAPALLNALGAKYLDSDEMFDRYLKAHQNSHEKCARLEPCVVLKLRNGIPPWNPVTRTFHLHATGEMRDWNHRRFCYWGCGNLNFPAATL